LYIDQYQYFENKSIVHVFDLSAPLLARAVVTAQYFLLCVPAIIPPPQRPKRFPSTASGFTP
jgi:hypothetical protein